MARITFKAINDQLASEGVDVELTRTGKNKQLTWVQKSTGIILKQYRLDQVQTLGDKDYFSATLDRWVERERLCSSMTLERWIERGRLWSDRCLGTNFRHKEYDDLPRMTKQILPKA